MTGTTFVFGSFAGVAEFPEIAYQAADGTVSEYSTRIAEVPTDAQQVFIDTKGPMGFTAFDLWSYVSPNAGYVYYNIGDAEGAISITVRESPTGAFVGDVVTFTPPYSQNDLRAEAAAMGRVSMGDALVPVDVESVRDGILVAGGAVIALAFAAVISYRLVWRLFNGGSRSVV